MLSIDGNAVRPSVTGTLECESEESIAPARDRLRMIHAACAVFQGTKRESWTGASEETNRCTPEPLSVA